MLLSEGADPNKTRSILPELPILEESPLTYAVYECNVNIVRLLIENGGKVNDKINITGMNSYPASTALQKCDNEALFNLLIKNGAKVTDRDICYIAATKDPALLSRFVSQYKDVRKSLIHCASLGGNISTLKWLRDNKFNLTDFDTEGNTAIHYLAGHNRWPIILDSTNVLIQTQDKFIYALKFLMEHKLDINQQNNNGDTPLHVAAARHSPYIVEALLRYGAKVNVTNKKTVFLFILQCI